VNQLSSELDIYDTRILGVLLRNRDGLGVNELIDQEVIESWPSRRTIIKHLRSLTERGFIERISSPTHKQKIIHKLTSRGVTVATKFAMRDYAGHIADEWTRQCEEQGFEDFHFLSDFTGKDLHKNFMVAVDQENRDLRVVQLFRPRSVEFVGHNPRKEGYAPNSLADFVRRHIKDFGNDKRLTEVVQDFFLNREYYGAIVAKSGPGEEIHLGIPSEIGDWELYTFVGIGFQDDLPNEGCSWEIGVVRVPGTPLKVKLTAELKLQAVKKILKRLFEESIQPSAEDWLDALQLGKSMTVAKCDNAVRKDDTNYCSVSKRACGLPMSCPYLPATMAEQQTQNATDHIERTSSSKMGEDTATEFGIDIVKNDRLRKLFVVFNVKMLDGRILKFPLGGSDLLSLLKSTEGLIGQGYVVCEEIPDIAETR